MSDVVVIISSAIKELERSLRLLKAARADIQRLKREQDENLEKTSLPFIIKKDRKAMSEEIFEQAQMLRRDDVSTWIRWCRDVEQYHKNEHGGTLPRAYTQLKSNIKRMLQAGMDLRRFKSEREAEMFC